MKDEYSGLLIKIYGIVQGVGFRPFVAKTARENQITKTALMIIGDVVKHSHYNRSELYNPAFTTEFREASISEKE